MSTENEGRMKEYDENAERIIYGCVGADRPDARAFIDEVDGILMYTCPECRKSLAEQLGPTAKGIRLLQAS